MYKWKCCLITTEMHDLWELPSGLLSYDSLEPMPDIGVLILAFNEELLLPWSVSAGYERLRPPQTHQIRCTDSELGTHTWEFWSVGENVCGLIFARDEMNLTLGLSNSFTNKVKLMAKFSWRAWNVITTQCT